MNGETRQPINTLVYNATAEVSGAIVTAVLTTIISFIPVFTMIGAEGKLFRPLAFTKTMALTASIIVALFRARCTVHDAGLYPAKRKEFLGHIRPAVIGSLKSKEFTRRTGSFYHCMKCAQPGAFCITKRMLVCAAGAAEKPAF